MKRLLFVLVLAVYLGGPAWAGPNQIYAESLVDAKTRPPFLVKYDRYFWLDDVGDAASFKETYIVLNFQANQLSRKPVFVRFAVVNRHLLRMNLLEIGWNKEVWERFLDGAVEPYFHQTLEVNVPWQRTHAGGRIEYFNKAQRKQASALWIDPILAANLIALTQTQVPVVNARWWFVQVSRQVGLNNKENGVGYYDWHGIKKRDDFFKLIALDEKASIAFGRVLRAALDHSGVSEQNRQIERLQALGGGAWYTLDATESTGRGNAIRNLGRGDMLHQAERHYGVLPNGLFAFLLCDNKGALQASAPDFIGPDDSPNAPKAGRIHVNLGCVRCHVEGLRPIDDWVRRNLRKPLALQANVDPNDRKQQEKALETEQIYFSNLDRQLATDRKVYEESLIELTGMTPVQIAKAYSRLYDSYVKEHKPLWTLAEVSRLVGMPEAEMRGKIEAYALAERAKGLGIDLLLSPYVNNPNYGVRVEQLEEGFGELMKMLDYPKR